MQKKQTCASLNTEHFKSVRNIFTEKKAMTEGENKTKK